MESRNYQCLCCGAPLHFDSATQKLVCRSCNNEFTVEQIDEVMQANAASSAESQMNWNRPEQDEFVSDGTIASMNCPSCGAEIIGDAHTIATECPYCGNPTVIDAHVSGALRPDYVLPFKISKEQAIAALKEFCKGKPLLPGSFLSAGKIEKIAGMYVPYWLFDSNSDADMTFNATRVAAWSDSRYNYTKTDHYLLYRSGNIDFNMIPVDGSSRMDAAYMEAVEPFNYGEMTDFTTGYLAGFMADTYDVDAEQSSVRANERAQNSTVEAFRQTAAGYASVTMNKSSIRMKNSAIHYALLPVWVLNTKFAGKTYRFAVNGQSGKLVGELPVSKGKYAGFLLGIFGALTAAVILIANLV